MDSGREGPGATRYNTSYGGTRKQDTSYGGTPEMTTGAGVISPITLVALIFLPWMMFTLILCLFCFAYRHFSLVVWSVVLTFLVFWVYLYYSDTSRRRARPLPKPRVFLGLVCLLALLISTVLGFYLFETKLLGYWNIQESRMYTNVLPSQAAVAHADAGIVTFAMGTRVDTARGASFKAGHKYCAAPIVRSGLRQDAIVQYWAVGLDCCTPRSGFECDDALNIEARAGIAVVNTSSLPAMLSAFLPNEWDLYKQAVDQAVGTYGILSTANPVFFRWLNKPLEVQDEVWDTTVWFTAKAICAYLLISILIAFALQLGSPRRPGMQSLVSGKGSRTELPPPPA